jgi:3-hydroxyisobutyrate dehydrogenase
VVAGARDAFERCEETLSHLFRNGRVIFVGEGGSAKVVKLLGNMVGAVQVLALAEAFDLGLRAGIDARAIFDGLGAGMGDCWALHVRPPHAGLVEGSPADRAFEPGSPLDYIVKDLDYFLSSAHVLGATPLLASLARELYGYASRVGLGTKDMAAVSLLFYDGDTAPNEADGPGGRAHEAG